MASQQDPQQSTSSRRARQCCWRLRSGPMVLERQPTICPTFPLLLEFCYDADSATRQWHYMRPSSTFIRIELRLAVFVVVIFLAISCVAQVGELVPFAPTQKDIKVATPAQDVPPCGPTPASSDAGHSSSQSSPQAKTVPHSVTLSWNASAPRSNSKQDAILGYYVYRSRTSKSYNESNQLNSDPILGTRCIDTTVAPKETYFYVVRAVAGNKKKSDNSNEAKATIPFP
jgi:hypothetical protein